MPGDWPENLTSRTFDDHAEHLGRSRSSLDAGEIMAALVCAHVFTASVMYLRSCHFSGSPCFIHHERFDLVSSAGS